MPKTMNSAHLMLINAGGMKRPIAKLNSQLPKGVVNILVPESFERPLLTCGSDTHTPCTCLERPNLGGVDPADRCQRQSVEDDQKIGESNDRVRGCTGNLHDNVMVTSDTAGDVFVVGTKDTANNKVADTHCDRAPYQESPAAKFIDEKEHDR